MLLKQTNTLAYYGVFRLQVCNVFMVQTPGHTHIRPGAYIIKAIKICTEKMW
jgi:hypothetical protein